MGMMHAVTSQLGGGGGGRNPTLEQPPKSAAPWATTQLSFSFFPNYLLPLLF